MLVDYYFLISFIYSEKKLPGLFCSHFTLYVPVYTGFISNNAVTLLFSFIYIVYTAAVLGSRVVSTMQMTICWIVIIWKERRMLETISSSPK